MRGEGPPTIEALFAKLGENEAEKLLDHADQYNPREPEWNRELIPGTGGSFYGVKTWRTGRDWYNGPKDKKAKPQPKKKVKLPGSYAEVQNADGTVSNVLMATFEVDGRHYALPTMVGGKQLSGFDPLQAAEERGLSKFPNFATQEEAEQWISENHGNITGTDD